MTSKKKISAEEFDRIFDEGKESIMDYLDLDNVVVKKPAAETRRVNVDFPTWMLDALDEEAQRLSIPRQAVIKTLIDEGLASRGKRVA